MNHVPQLQEERFGYYFLSGKCFGTLETIALPHLIWSIFYQGPVINGTLPTSKIAVHKIQDSYDVVNRINEIN